MVVGLALAVAPAAPVQNLSHLEATRMSMACAYAIDAYGPDAAALPGIVDSAFDEVDRIDQLMSHYKASSPVSAINRGAAHHPVAVPQELFDFLAEAMRYNRESDGAFDITVGPLMKAWGFFGGDGRRPTDAELAAARRRVGAGHVLLNADARTVAFDQEGVAIDLGGIAKGYAVDRAVTALHAQGIAAALVSAGGSTIYALGAPPGRAGWNVTIQDPLDARKVARTMVLKDRALSIAGTSEKWFESGGVRYSHIMDPRTGMPVQGILTVAVLSPTGTAGDALDDALFVLGVKSGKAYLHRMKGVEAWWYVPSGKAWKEIEGLS